MEYNGKNYELIHDKTGNLDCPDCVFGNIDCSVTEAVNKCNMYQVWKECAQEKESEQQSNCNLPHVINNEAEASSDGVAVCCDTCKYVDGFRCNHPQGCETNGDYELWEQQIDL